MAGKAWTRWDRRVPRQRSGRLLVPVFRSRGHKGAHTPAWWGSALTAALALIGLVVITGAPGTPGLALRADAYNQMTGLGSTASAITLNWTNGLLNSSNQPIAGVTSTDGGPELNPNPDRTAGAGPLSFMDSDFKNLQVMVSQTQNITHQSVTVSWKGAPPSNGSPSTDFMQMMECYGDSASGPSPEGCEYGSTGMLGTQIPNQSITSRLGPLCTAGSVPSTTSPPSGPGGGPAQGCDPYEPAAETPAHCDPSATGSAACSGGAYSIPFVPDDDPANPLYGTGTTGVGTGTLFNQSNTNEVQAVYTAADGTGQRQFETLTATQAPGLGCGEAEGNGQIRSCWLVIVPRGSYEPNGFKSGTSVPLFTSPLSAANWAQRIQVHLGYAPLTANCPPTVTPDAMVGTQVAFRAVSSWQSILNPLANCSKQYSYTATSESAATSLLASPGGAGLAFTTIPIGSEATRSGGQPPTLPTILYAPVAVTALGFGFNINQGAGGEVTTPVQLTPSLLARALTQVYQQDLPDDDPPVSPAPTWAAGNPATLTADPAFQALNPAISPAANGVPEFPLITGDHSGVNQQIWRWVQSDPNTATWLDGGTDPSNPVTADPDYVALNLGKSPAPDNFSEAYTGTLTCGKAEGLTYPTTDASPCFGALDKHNPNAQSCVVLFGDVADPQSKACDVLNSEDLLPVESNFDQAAATVLTASDPANTRDWFNTAEAPDGTPGWWSTVGTELPGRTFMWTVNDMPDLALYGLTAAALCDPAGAGCVQPSVADVTAALNSATPDSAGLLHVNPATVPSGAYPLVDVVYAAVPTDQSASALSDFANFISYAAGPGQTTGSAAGDLPPGYLPLPASLQAQAQSVATQLRSLAGIGPAPALTVTESPSPPIATQSTTLTATVTGQNGTPTGTVQFTVGGTAIGGPVSLSPQGTASTTVVFTAPGTQPLTAIYTPDTSNYASTFITLTENVLPAGSLNTGDIPMAAAVPVVGLLSLTVQTQSVVTLTVSADGSTATAVTTPIVLEDTLNTYPGWSVTGQVSAFSGVGAASGWSIPGDRLGWAPAASTLAPGATLGAVVAPGSPGLGSTAAVLAEAPSGYGNGFGTTTLDPTLTLAIAPTDRAGPYNGTLTISAIAGSL
jgi:hypothetical protein